MLIKKKGTVFGAVKEEQSVGKMSSALQTPALNQDASRALEIVNGGTQQTVAATEKDISYWQRSLEALAQKVIVGDLPALEVSEWIANTVVSSGSETRKKVEATEENSTAESSSAQSIVDKRQGEICANDPMDQLEDGAASAPTTNDAMDEHQHDSNLFRLSCCCEACLRYRETIIQLFVEDFEYNTLWERLQLLIKKFYGFIPEEEDSQLFLRYMELMDKSSLKWLTDGRINTKKNIQISLGSNLPLSNEMTFILVFSMLYTRDPHQLFELLCLQLRSIVKAYSQGLQDLITETADGELQYHPVELLIYILDGYDKLCHSAKALSPLLFELQRGHLQQFSLTWCLINKRMYQRFVYLEVQKIIPECILKLKELLFDEEYKSMVYRFIQFDDEMNSTSQIWRDVWSLLHDYHRAKEDQARRKRISSAHSLLLAVRDSEFIFSHPEVQRTKDRPIVEWLANNDRNMVWQYVVHSLKSRWVACNNPRLTASIENIQCRKCNFALATHYVECNCRTCLFAGGTCLGKSKEQLYCAKCSFFKKLDRDYLDYIGEFFNKPLCEKQKQLNGSASTMGSSLSSTSSSSSSSSGTDIALPEASSDTSAIPDQSQLEQKCLASGKTQEVGTANTSNMVVALADNTSLYHISWAIFKHLPERVAYTWTTLEPKRFCIFQGEPCKINACRVAINIIAMLYPLNLSKFLIRTYHPLREEERRKMAENWNIDVKNFMQRFCDDINKRWRTEVADRIHPLHFLDLLWESDDSESALLSDMASAFAEWFLIDFQFPQRNVIYQYFTKFFLVKGTDIEFDMKCFEAISSSRLFNWSTPASPLRQMIADDMQSKLLGVNWSSILPEEALAAINGEEFTSGKFEGVSPGSVLVAAATGGNPSNAAMAAAVIEPIVKLCTDDGAICKDCKECFTETVTKSEIFEKEIKKPLVEALKLAASNKILETELKTLQKEHSMLKDMVRDLEQIHEQKHSTVITQQCANSSGNNSSEPPTISSGTGTINSVNGPSKSINTANKTGNVGGSQNTDRINTVSATSDNGTNNKTTVTPVKTMLNQATNTSTKTLQAPNAQNKKVIPIGTVSQQPVKVAIKTNNTPVKPLSVNPTSTVSKVTSKTSSTHPLPGGTALANSTTPVTAAASSVICNNAALPPKEDHKKTCHRGVNGGEKGDGSCVCYYCTLFGQSVCLECNHNQRTNETRDRLRKKIKQLQNNKDNQQLKSLNLKNIKIPPGGLLKKINTNKSNSTNAVTNNNGNGCANNSTISSNNSVNSNTSTMVPVMKNSITSKVEALKHSNSSSAIHSPIGAAATTKLHPSNGGLAQTKSVVPTKVVGGDACVQSSPVHKVGPTANLIKKISHQQPVEEPSLDAILRFIEGDDNDDKEKNCNKKAAKKVKQKQRKQELKKITELGELSLKFSEFHLEEQRAQKRLQFQQNLKKKDKKQLLEDIKAYEEKKVQLQADINSLVSSIKNNNPEFSFNMDGQNEPKDALPRKDNKNTILETGQQLPAKLQHNINLLQQQKQRQQQQLLQQHQQVQKAQPSPVLVSQDNVSIDPARRMVTIKRTFLSHSEPQVTVTAKGPSPDKDQLLYTFINGQLVPPEQQHASARHDGKQKKKHQENQRIEKKLEFSDVKQKSDKLVKNQSANDTDIFITEKLLKLSLRDQSQQQQAQSMQEVDELMQKLQLQTVDGKRKKEDIVSLTSRLSDKLTQIRGKTKNPSSETHAKSATQMLQKIVRKLELLSESVDDDKQDKGRKKNKKKDKPMQEIDEIDALANWCEGLDVNNTPKKSDRKTVEKSMGKILNRKHSKDSISSIGSGAQKAGKVHKDKVKDEGKTEPENSEVMVKLKDSKSKVLRRKSEVYIDPEFDNNTFKLLNLEDTESGEEEEEVEAEQEESNVPITTTRESYSSRSSTPVCPQEEESPRSPTPMRLSPMMVTSTGRKSNRKKNDKSIKDHAKHGTISVPSMKDDKQIKNKENLAPHSQSQKISKTAQNVTKVPPSNASNRKASSVGIVSSVPDKNSNVSKRQKKLLLKYQEQTKTTQQTSQAQQKKPLQHTLPCAVNRHIDKAIKCADRLAKTGNERRSKVNITGDTTLELLNDSNPPVRNAVRQVKIPNTFPPGDTSFGASIMDQLSRGIRVEGLQLPPGITLTRVDAAAAEAIKSKRESIKKICEPMQTVQPEVATMVPQQLLMGAAGVSPSAGMFLMNPMVAQQPSTMVASASGQDAVIMVDTNKFKCRGKNSGSSNVPENDKKSGKRSKRKNKNKCKPDSTKSTCLSKNDAGKNQKGNASNGTNIVTLRNPMFQGVRPATATVSTGEPSAQQGSRFGLGYDQPATIFKNDNGMFTIRNPALHQALSGGAPPSTSGFRPFNTNYLVENGIFPPQSGAASSGTPAAYFQQHQQVAKDMNLPSESSGINSASFSATVEPPRKCNSAIGSEMKNAQKQKQQQQHHHQQSSWQNLNGAGSSPGSDLFNPLTLSAASQNQRCYSPFENLQYGLTGSQDYLKLQGSSSGFFPMNSPSVVSAIGSERSQARAQAAAALSTADAGCRRLFDAGGSCASTHCCDDSPNGSFFDGLSGNASGSAAANHKYDDLSFLQSLQPGQRLNSEVTIHNINESKFLRQQQLQGQQNLPNDIEITRIPAQCSSAPGGGFGCLPTHTVTHPLLMSPVSSTISSEAAVSVSVGGGPAVKSDSAAAVSEAQTNLLAMNDIETSLFLQKYQQQQLQLQQQLQQQMQQLQLQPLSRKQQQQLIGEYGENIFAPNQMVNLNELESEERDIESFKRFNYYFDPPKNKPKINLNVKEIVINNGNNTVSQNDSKQRSMIAAASSARHGVCSSDGSINGGSSSRSSISNDNNPGGVSIGEDIQPIRPQAPIGTPSLKGLQHQITPLSSAGGTMYPASSDSPASSASIFDGISSSLSSHAHSCDDLFTDLLSSAGTSNSAIPESNLSLNLNLNLAQLQQSNSDPIAYDSAGYGMLLSGNVGGAPSIASVSSSSTSGGVASGGKASVTDLTQSIIIN